MVPLEWSEEGRNKMIVAYVKAQGAMGDVIKDANNAHFDTKYATLAGVLGAVMPAFTENGIVAIQSPSFDGEVLTIETVLMHVDGGWMKSILSVRPGKPDAQGLGSAITYLRRYVMLSLAGVAPEDDDGNAASVGGEGGKKFEQPLKGANGGRKSSPVVIAAKNSILASSSLETWEADSQKGLSSMSRQDRADVLKFLDEQRGKKDERVAETEEPAAATEESPI